MARKICLLTFFLTLVTGACSQPGVEVDVTLESPMPGDETRQPVDTPQTSLPHGTELSPLDPIPGENKMVRGTVFVDSVQVLVMESFPIQVALSVEGTLPDPCHKLRATVESPSDPYIIQVELYSLVDPEMLCIQVIHPFVSNIPIGSFRESGQYQVLLNGEMVGEFEL